MSASKKSMAFKSSQMQIELEVPAHENAIEALVARVFGPGRFTRAAFKLREGTQPDPELSFVALNGDEVIGTVRLTAILIDDRSCWLLGPICVAPQFHDCGVGSVLMKTAVERAKHIAQDGQVGAGVLLVGDLEYYGQFGFKQVKRGQISLPWPADPARILFCAFEGEVVAGIARPDFGDRSV